MNETTYNFINFDKWLKYYWISENNNNSYIEKIYCPELNMYIHKYNFTYMSEQEYKIYIDGVNIEKYLLQLYNSDELILLKEDLEIFYIKVKNNNSVICNKLDLVDIINSFEHLVQPKVYKKLRRKDIIRRNFGQS